MEILKLKPATAAFDSMIGVVLMETKRSNKSIICTVKHCAYHACDEDYCSLNSIRVGTHESNPTQSQCVDCESFRLDSENHCSAR